MGIRNRGVATFMAIGLVAGGVVAGCGASDSSSAGSSSGESGGGGGGEIVIAEVAPFTGAVAFYGQELDAAARLAVKDYGGDLAARVKYVKFDDGCDPAKGVTAMRKALAEEPAIILGPPCTAVVQATQQLANQAQVPHFIQALAPGLTENDDYVFRTIPNQDMDYTALSKYARDDMKLGSVAILHGDDAYSESEGKTFRAAWEKAGGKVAAEQTFTTGGKDVSATVLRLRDSGADAIFMGGYEGDVGLATKTARQLGLEQPILGGTPMANEQYRKAAGAASEGSTYVSSVNPDDPAQADFYQEWAADESSPVTDVSASVYTGIGGLMEALKASKGDARKQELRDALHEVDFETKAGLAQWTETGELSQPTIIIGRVAKGEATMLQRVSG
jgi:branched-chain amino acid transport system substrate-binding protein